MSILFAATYPERARPSSSIGGLARSTYAPDYPWALPAEDLIASGTELIAPHWGEGAIVEIASPSVADDPACAQLVRPAGERERQPRHARGRSSRCSWTSTCATSCPACTCRRS